MLTRGRDSSHFGYWLLQTGKMAESSLFAQRLQALTERRRLQERILSTRRELEEERLRAQRLKRKSLRDQWLMEGTSSPMDDNDHMSSVWEAQNHIQELEQDLSSLQSQMQQLDNPELHQGRRQREEYVKVLKEVKLSSPDGIGEVDETSPSSPEGLFGRECSPEKAEVKVSPMAEEDGDCQPQQGSSEAAPDVKPAWQSLDPSEAIASCQSKPAVEEMVIRDHLGQEVGSMDAVGQKQRSIGKEEELEGHTDLGSGSEEESRLSPPHRALSQGKTPGATERQVDTELGSRDGPEGESPTSQDCQSPSKPLRDENSCFDSPKRQADGKLEMGSLANEAALMGGRQKELSEQGAKEAEPAQDIAAGYAEPVMGGQENQVRKQGLQESCGSEATMLGQGGESKESWLDLPKQPRPDQILPQEEAKMSLLDPAKSSSSLSGPSLQDQISSFQETEGPLLESVLSLIPNQSPSTFSPLQERKESFLALASSSQQESLLDPNPPSQQDHLSSSPEQKPSSLQGGVSSLQDQILSPLCEAQGKLLDQIPTSLQEQSASLPDQVLPRFPDQFTSLPGQIPSCLHKTERSLEISTALQGQERSVLEAKESFPDIVPSLSNQLSSLPDQITSLQEAEGLSLEEIPVTLQDQIPTAPEAQISSLPEADIILLDQIPFSVDEDKHLHPGEILTSLPDQIPPVLQDQKPTFLEDSALSSLQEAGGSLTDQIQASLPCQTSPSLLEAKGSPPGQAQPTLVEQMPILMQSQASCLQEVEKSLSVKQIPISLPEEMPTLSGQALSPNKVQTPTLEETTTAPDALPSYNQDLGQRFRDKNVTVERQELKEGGDGSLAAVEEETKEVLENLHAEQQPLLKEPKASADAQDMSVGNSQPKAGILNLQAGTSQDAPTYTTTSANTASSCQLQSVAPHQGEGQEQGQSRRKQKSCQCCLVM
ncbi:paralemmin-3 isoform X2 [Rhineura floridana]|uniref:paralemmin-3 isoform X2 n=1 Tax=Rhineura floridana TaxID=261503 RepID=UPI002AC8224B|nr:paralemmin-3 isoform X2 [Rhineura floridana]